MEQLSNGIFPPGNRQEREYSELEDDFAPTSRNQQEERREQRERRARLAQQLGLNNSRAQRRARAIAAPAPDPVEPVGFGDPAPRITLSEDPPSPRKLKRLISEFIKRLDREFIGKRKA